MAITVNEDGTASIDDPADVPILAQAMIDFGTNTDTIDKEAAKNLGNAISGEGASLSTAQGALQGLYDRSNA